MSKTHPVIVALGMFDGIHIGHRALLCHTCKVAKQNGWQSAVYTFYNHPKSAFGAEPKLLSTVEERRSALLALGIDNIRMETFDSSIALLSPQAFVERLLSEFDMRAVSVGFNYAFGRNRQGSAHTLQTLGEKYGFKVFVVQPITLMQETVSSTRIRELIENGQVCAASKMLCAPYSLTGIVEENRHIGASLGFPTANLKPSPDKLLPKEGVYITNVLHNACAYTGVTNIGRNPTVAGKTTTIETHILNFSQSIYGQELKVEFIERLRDETCFSNRHELAEQIKRDVNAALIWQRKKAGCRLAQCADTIV
ncbi:MAG: Riboflavin biosynthesis protein RibF [Firmicutes bacterium ADurb.Bin356]|nr:MAG: Riboflavin biosynthesis protein RibF [Firmicutes bacterium ADurb.Bin356]